ncbi:hypothetical protein AJ87_38720 [Rhizobium yanglingense]|nr:hypothetical protein AJ87_38720 [Rhizobium yanglingense]
MLGDIQEMRNDLVAVEDFGRLGDLPQEQPEPVNGSVQPDDCTTFQPRVPHGFSKGQARDSFGRDADAARRDKEFPVIGIEAEPCLIARLVGDRDQAFAAKVKHEPSVVKGPMAGQGDCAGKAHCAVFAWP